MISKLKTFKADVLSGLAVFLIALPLCLGIALASGAPLFSGIISGIVGGIVVGLLSGSEISVAGPAAGLTAIVLAAIGDLGSFQAFLAALALAGVIQLILGFAKAGIVSSYLPSNVIEGMLAAIGVIIILKQLPHAAGYAAGRLQPGAVAVTLASLALLAAWDRITAVFPPLKTAPGALAAVTAGVALNELLKAAGSSWALSQAFLVTLPVPASLADFFAQFSSPDFSSVGDARVWMIAATIAAVASIETLLNIEAADKLDPLKRFTDADRELKAQGAGNLICGLLGGLPVTSVIVRSSANVSSGAKTKVSAVAHGVFLAVAVLAFPQLLNRIPLACLAAVLLAIGFKLAGPSVFRHMWRNGRYQFVPFIVTVVAVVSTDLLKGVGVGLAVSVFFILKGNMSLAYVFKKEKLHAGEKFHIELAQEVSFLNKAAIKQLLAQVPEGGEVVIDASNTSYIDHDVLELIRDFLKVGSKDKGVTVRLKGFKKSYKIDHANRVGAE